MPLKSGECCFFMDFRQKNIKIWECKLIYFTTKKRCQELDMLHIAILQAKLQPWKVFVYGNLMTKRHDKRDSTVMESTCNNFSDKNFSNCCHLCMQTSLVGGEQRVLEMNEKKDVKKLEWTCCTIHDEKCLCGNLMTNRHDKRD